ncbi:MAG: ABC transporter permease [Spirochaetes bacterium]|nr:ABC transporter permease [Spirochaetota bacterium]
MKFFSFFKAALNELRKNSFRSLLTMLGIIIGVSSFIAIAGLIQSATVIIKSKIYTYGRNAVSVSSEGKEFSLQDCGKLKSYIRDIQFITPVHFAPSLSAKYKNRHIASRVYGASNDFLLIRDWEIVNGRKFSDIEISSYQKTVIIGNTQKTVLFGNIDPVGKTFYINGAPFRIIGVLAATGKALSGRDFDNKIIVPYTTMGRNLAGKSSFSEILLSVSGSEALDSTIGSIRRYFSQAHNSPLNKLKYIKIFTSREKLDSAKNVIGILALLLSAVTIVSVIIGGINIMNIMLAGVRERTKEIGIRLAVGAKRLDILAQFLIESSLISLTGGLIGIVIGLGINITVVYIIGWPFIFSVFYVFISFVSSCIVGVLFGMYPAHIASGMIPVQALYSS